MNSEMSRPGNGRARFSGGSFARRLLPAACIAATLTPALVEAAVIFPLSYPADNQYSVDLPYSVSYPAHGNASVTGQGSNLSGAAFTVDVTDVTTGSPSFFGVYGSDTQEGVPWDDASGLLTDGNVKSWAIDSNGSPGVRKITITFVTPVTALKFAVTDIDVGGEQVQVQAFPTVSGGSAIALTDHNLAPANPTSVPSLAQGVAHTGNDAYVVDSTKVTAVGSGVYANSASAPVSNSSASVLFAYDDNQPVGRIEITFNNTGNSGIWIAGLSFNDPPPLPPPPPPVDTTTAVPTLSQLGLIALAGLLAGFGAIERRRRA